MSEYYQLCAAAAAAAIAAAFWRQTIWIYVSFLFLSLCACESMCFLQ